MVVGECDRSQLRSHAELLQTDRICERIVVSATKCAWAISSALRPCGERRQHERLALVSWSILGLRAHRRRARLGGAPAIAARSVRPIIGRPATTSASVVSTWSSDCSPSIHPTAPASRYSTSTVRRRSAVSTTTLASRDTAGRIRSIPLPTPLRGLRSRSTHPGLEVRDVLHDVVRRGAGAGLDRPRALRQRQFQPGGKQGVLLDNERTGAPDSAPGTAWESSFRDGRAVNGSVSARIPPHLSRCSSRPRRRGVSVFLLMENLRHDDRQA